MHVGLLGFGAIFVAMVAGAATQGAIGFGMNLVLVPVVALIVPEALPGALVLAGVPLSVFVAMRERHGIDRRRLGWIITGRLPGTVVGVLVVALMSGTLLATLAGVAVLTAVGVSLWNRPLPVNERSACAAGVASGVLGTAAAIDGPPMALLYQRHPGPTIRATLASVFVVGTAMSLTALGLAGRVHGWQVLLAVALLPALVLGLAISRRVIARIGERSLRPALLAFATATGVAAIVRGLF